MLSDFFDTGLAPSNLLEEPPPPPDGSEVGTDAWVSARIDEMLEREPDDDEELRPLGSDRYWMDDDGELVPLDDEPSEPVEFEPLPEGAGIPDAMPRGHRPPPGPPPSEFQLRVRAFLEQQEKSPGRRA